MTSKKKLLELTAGDRVHCWLLNDDNDPIDYRELTVEGFRCYGMETVEAGILPYALRLKEFYGLGCHGAKGSTYESFLYLKDESLLSDAIAANKARLARYHEEWLDSEAEYAITMTQRTREELKAIAQALNISESEVLLRGLKLLALGGLPQIKEEDE